MTWELVWLKSNCQVIKFDIFARGHKVCPFMVISGGLRLFLNFFLLSDLNATARCWLAANVNQIVIYVCLIGIFLSNWTFSGKDLFIKTNKRNTIDISRYQVLRTLIDPCARFKEYPVGIYWYNENCFLLGMSIIQSMLNFHVLFRYQHRVKNWSNHLEMSWLATRLCGLLSL